MKRFFTIITIFLTAWFIGFATYIYVSYSYKYNNFTSNVIVVFYGDRNRIETGISLIKANYAPLLFVAGVPSKDQLYNLLKEYQVPIDQVIYGLDADNLTNNAIEAVNFILSRNITSIRLVTSEYDMILAMNELHSILPERYGVSIIPHSIVSKKIPLLKFFKTYNIYLKFQITELFKAIFI
jgi:uncharacterized SAM-binding protein YcdF (DUF218 family)